MLKANTNFGYTDKEISDSFSAPQICEYDYTGFARQLVKAPPAPDFKILLFPHREGAEQPRTEWNAARTRLTVTWSEQEDVIDFTSHGDGRTRLRMTRDGRESLVVK